MDVDLLECVWKLSEDGDRKRRSGTIVVAVAVAAAVVVDQAVRESDHLRTERGLKM